MMTDEMMMGDDLPSKMDYVWSTIDLGLIIAAKAMIPVFLWWFFEKDQPGMDSFDAATNDWYYISWWTWWIGNLVAWAPAFFLWIPSYFSDTAMMVYLMTGIWAMLIGLPVGIFVWTSLFVSGIEWGKTWKEIWVVFLLFNVGNMVLDFGLMESVGDAQMWYMWHAMERHCRKDAAGNCVFPEGESPAEIAWAEENGMDAEGDDDFDM